MPDDEALEDWIEELDRRSNPDDIKNFLKEQEEPDEDWDSVEQFDSKDYKQYLEEEKAARGQNWYERFANRTSFFRHEFPDLRDEHEESLALLDWDIDPDQVVPAATVMALLIAPASIVTFFIPMPTIFKVFFLILPIVAFFYMVKYPKLKANQKLVNASEGLVLSILYMVVYMRHSPNLEGALSFAAQRLDGEIGNDFNRMLWKLDMRVYEDVSQAFDDYMTRWKPFNKGFVESLSLLKSAIRSPSAEKRDELLDQAINTLMDHTRKQTNSFVRDLKMPIMVIHGLGILLPVLGIILFPLVANFMGGGNMAIYLAFLYNILLPTIVYAILRTLLTQRPMSFSSASGNVGDDRASLTFTVFGREFETSMFAVSVPLFILLMAWPATHYYSIFFGPATFPASPSTLVILREAMIIVAIGVPVGVHTVYGYADTIELQEETTDIEQEFPKSLYELGNALDKGQPIERAVDDAVEGSRELSISDMFKQISYNIKQYGMTFRQAVFDPKRGAINRYPSALIGTIMEIVAESAEKGTETAAVSIMSISQYLENIQETQERLEELMGETLSSIQFLGYVLAPTISGIAVGMGATISSAFNTINKVFQSTGGNGSGAGTGSGAAAGAAPTGGLAGGAPTGLFSLFGGGTSIPPGVLQLVVGIYILQISYLIGLLIVRLMEGDNAALQRVTIGKLFISSSLFYTIVVVVIVSIFGSIIAGVGST